MDVPTITNALEFFQTRLKEGRALLLPDIQNIADILIALEVVFAGLYLALGASSAVKEAARKILIIGFFFYCITQYSNILGWLVDGFLYAGGLASSEKGLSIAVLKDPAKIFITGLSKTTPIVNKLYATMGTMYLGILSVDALLLILCIIISVFSFAVISINVFVTYLEYLLVATAGFILIPFGIFKPTAFIAERVFGAILGLGIKLMVLAIVVGLSHAFLETITVPETSSWQDGVKFAVIGLCLAFLSVHAPSIAQSLLSGTPQLSAGSVLATGGATTSLANGTISGGKSVGSTVNKATHAVSAATGALHGGASVSTAALKQSTPSPSMGSLMMAGSTGAVKGAFGAAKEALSERIQYGAVGSPEGGRAYREGIGDRSLGSSSSYPGAKRNHGLVGSFRAGQFAVAGYRNLHATQEESKQRKKDSASSKVANDDDVKSKAEKRSDNLGGI